MSKKKDKEKNGKGSFWTTLPGCLTGIAALITAIGGLITVFYATGVLPKNPASVEFTPVPPITSLPASTPPISPTAISPTTSLTPIPPILPTTAVTPTASAIPITLVKSPTAIPVPQQVLVRWGPTAGYVAGICINSCDNFVAWQELKAEIESRLLTQVERVRPGSTVRLSELAGKNDWVVEVIDQSGTAYANVWFGPDPEKAWSFDGLVRIGVPKPLEVWNTFQRNSDGTYNLLK